VVFYRVSLFLATLCAFIGLVIVVASLFHPGMGIAIGAIVFLGSYSLIRGLRRRIFPSNAQ
jgi:hypothetical protein